MNFKGGPKMVLNKTYCVKKKIVVSLSYQDNLQSLWKCVHVLNFYKFIGEVSLNIYERNDSSPLCSCLLCEVIKASLQRLMPCLISSPCIDS